MLKADLQKGDWVQRGRSKGIILDTPAQYQFYVLVKWRNGKEELASASDLEKTIAPPESKPKKIKRRWSEIAIDLNKWIHDNETEIYAEIPHDAAMFTFEKKYTKIKGCLPPDIKAIKRYDSPNWWFYSLRLVVSVPPDPSWIIKELNPDFLSETKVRLSNNTYIWELLEEGFELGKNLRK